MGCRKYTDIHQEGGWIISEDSATDIVTQIDKIQNKLEMTRENETYVYDIHVKKPKHA